MSQRINVHLRSPFPTLEELNCELTLNTEELRSFQTNQNVSCGFK